MWNAKHDPSQINDESLYEHYDHVTAINGMNAVKSLLRLNQMIQACLSPLLRWVKQVSAWLASLAIMVTGMALLHNCVKDVADANYDREYLEMLLGGNALDFYGDRLRQSLLLSYYPSSKCKQYR